MSEFKVERIRHNVELTLATKERMVGTVFLDPVARNHAGPQDPRELLNDEQAFFPFDVQGGKVILVAKDQVRIAKYPVDRLGIAALRTSQARVILTDGHVEGAIIVEARTEADRLLDHLNHFEGRFLPMLTANKTIHTLVNRRMIVGIEI
jgi:hypothetical protein